MRGHEFLSFTRRERTGIITLLVILFLLAVLPRYILPPKVEPIPAIIADHTQQLSRTENNYRNYHRESYDTVYRGYRYDRGDNRKQYSRGVYHDRYPRGSAYNGERRYPNNNFRERRNPAGSWTKRSYAYTDSAKESRASFKHNATHYANNDDFQKKRTWRRIVEINSADTTAFIDLPGIGSKLAARIVLFREKLGGFNNVYQLGEVYGLQDSVFRQLLPLLRCDSSMVKKININTANSEDLKTHPYIRWKNAQIIEAYRQQHGAYTSLQDLHRLAGLDTSSLQKISPYLSFR